MSIPSFQAIEHRLSPLRRKLAEHSVYESIESVSDLKLFMESHVFAVWDFMSLLKSLQQKITCVDVPWAPSPYRSARRFLNEIVLCEESDLARGETVSHFELYLRAMRECNADTRPIENVLHAIRNGASVTQALAAGEVPPGAREFCHETFRVAISADLPAIAGAFTFGREDLIPTLFSAFVRRLAATLPKQLDTFVYYLERHIEVDGDDHGPMAAKMMHEVCGENPDAWHQAGAAAERALLARITLWDSIATGIHQKRIALAG